jgi:hypothetical protein
MLPSISGKFVLSGNCFDYEKSKTGTVQSNALNKI